VPQLSSFVLALDSLLHSTWGGGGTVTAVLTAVVCVLLCRGASGGGSVNRSRLVQLLVFLARDEEPAYKRRSVRRLAGRTHVNIHQHAHSSTAPPLPEHCCHRCLYVEEHHGGFFCGRLWLSLAVGGCRLFFS
jgi:hypothetical protein